ncbi:hypothetical protein [Phenylobacterium sp.]|uniref:hypothetical protein n=1 Tax=Phenylobacterium sp. TaxID=1871053 RepID=UPI00374CB94D
MKPQSAAADLDGTGRAPHPLAMTPSDKDPKPQLLSREQKLAQALRANLRRRKADVGRGDEKPAPMKNGDEG